MSAEPTLAAQLREMIVPPARVELIEQAAARLDELERDLYHEERMHAEWKETAKLTTLALARAEEAERQLENAQYWRERHCRESEQHARRSSENWKAWKAAERQLATVARTTIKQCAKAIDPTQYPNECDRAIAWKCYDAIRALAPHAAKEPQAAPAPIPTERTPLDAVIKIAELERECERLRVVADASKSFVNSEGSESVVRGLALVDAVRALERGDVKS
jgi:hypothetical protein